MRSPVVKGLAIAILLQLLVLIGMYVKAVIPLWTGTEVRVKTLPVDPRSLFRGNYARLNYEFSTLDYDEFMTEMPIRSGEVVYVTLQQNESGLYEYADVFLDKPEQGPYLRGRVEYRSRFGNNRPVRIKYGIEAYFAPKEKALELENALRDGGVAVLMVGDDGRARLKAVVGE